MNIHLIIHTLNSTTKKKPCISFIKFLTPTLFDVILLRICKMPCSYLPTTNTFSNNEGNSPILVLNYVEATSILMYIY